MKLRSCSQAWVRVVLSTEANEINSFPAAWCKPEVISVANLLFWVQLLLIGCYWCVEQNQTNSLSFTEKTRRGLMWWLPCSEHLWLSAIACQSYLTVAMYWTVKFLYKDDHRLSHPECLLFVLMQSTAGVLLRHLPSPLSLVLNHPAALSSSINKQCGFICLYKCWSLTAGYSLPVYLTCQEQREKKNVFVTAFFFFIVKQRNEGIIFFPQTVYPQQQHQGPVVNWSRNIFDLRAAC